MLLLKAKIVKLNFKKQLCIALENISKNLEKQKDWKYNNRKEKYMPCKYWPKES